MLLFETQPPVHWMLSVSEAWKGTSVWADQHGLTEYDVCVIPEVPKQWCWGFSLDESERIRRIHRFDAPQSKHLSRYRSQKHSGIQWCQDFSVDKPEVLFPKRERVFHRGIQTPRNKWKHEAVGRVLLSFRGVWIPRWDTKHEFWK